MTYSHHHFLGKCFWEVHPISTVKIHLSKRPNTVPTSFSTARRFSSSRAMISKLRSCKVMENPAINGVERPYKLGKWWLIQTPFPKFKQQQNTPTWKMMVLDWKTILSFWECAFSVVNLLLNLEGMPPSQAPPSLSGRILTYPILRKKLESYRLKSAGFPPLVPKRVAK